MKTIKYSDIPISVLEHGEFEPIVSSMLATSRLHRIATINPEYLVQAYRDAAFLQILRSSDLAVPDGTGIILLARFFTNTSLSFKDRLTGVTLTQQLLMHAERTNLRVAILLRDDSLTTDESLSQTLSRDYPQLNYRVLRGQERASEISAFKPEILFITFGSPAQDTWIEAHRAELPSVRIACGVGGTFDFISGTIQRAPRFMRAYGLEWLWRLILEPKRFRRIIRATCVFPLLVLTRRIPIQYE